MTHETTEREMNKYFSAYNENALEVLHFLVMNEKKPTEISLDSWNRRWIRLFPFFRSLQEKSNVEQKGHPLQDNIHRPFASSKSSLRLGTKGSRFARFRISLESFLRPLLNPFHPTIGYFSSKTERSFSSLFLCSKVFFRFPPFLRPTHLLHRSLTPY